MDKTDYIARLRLRIEHLHNCSAVWRDTVGMHETFTGGTLWVGDVEIFDLNGHPKAKRCYGWSYGEPEELIAILELPPVTDAQSAVKVGVSCRIKSKRLENH